MIRLIKDIIICLALWGLIALIVSGLNIIAPSYIALVGWWCGVVAVILMLIDRGAR